MAEIALDYERLSDVELAQFVVRRDPHAVRVVTQRNNQRLFRAAFSILKNRAEAEEAVQEAYLKAFAAMDGFAGRSSLSTWLTRIAINEALARARRAERRARIEEEHQLVNLDTYREKFMASSDSARSPEANVMRRQLAKLLERAIGNLPELFRPVFVLRDIEGLSVEETSEVLQIPRETVKTRLLRARRRLQQELDPELREALHDTFPFAGANCEALTEKVLTRYLALPG